MKGGSCGVGARRYLLRWRHWFADDLYAFFNRPVASAGWLYAATRNAITDYYRPEAHWRELPVGVLPDTDVAAGW